MSFSIYSIFAAVFWFSLFVCLGAFVKRRPNLFLLYRPLLFLIALSLIRLFIPLKPSFAITLHSDEIAPFVIDLLRSRFVMGTFLASFFTLFICLSFIIAFYLLIRMAKKIYGNYRLVSHSQNCEDVAIHDLLHGIMAETRSVRQYRIVLSKNVQVPAVIGFFSPVIILPEFISDFSIEDTYFFLYHEWQHFLNKDLWIKLMIEILCCFMWWNPIVYLLRRNVDQALELKCDLRVTANLSEHEKDAYLIAIRNAIFVSLTRAVSAEPVMARFIGGYAGNETQQNESVFNIKQRFLTVKHYEKSSTPLVRAAFISFSLLFLFSFCVIVQPENSAAANLNEPVYVFKMITPENSYLVDNGDQSYSLIVDEEPIVSLTEGMIRNPPHFALEIREK